MKTNAFTLPFTIFIAFITILIVTGSASIFKTQIQYEKMIQNYYLASTKLNLALIQTKESSLLSGDFKINYGDADVTCQATDSSLATFNCKITLQNGYTLTKTTNP
ncbi:competence protein ComG [Listeria swaminathanii]|uniref:Competence protein ComG n=1 Tax=Listeria swaminathanii TaxID=2713501 RepID=A0ABU2IBM3_9LIST|nr:competence protein ComG [Listeria swaminathanii]MDT0016622.1 competence protein ComG [Listeria swaminathanii]MDT0022058.1 competence protein ComG [Listeria swaminathanii]MDT0033022.1 competence protein ComG [Listeria swaminathanii]MDT0051128.1 competence protein ComG [Listeria swaminathanii]MDT0053893.1 competence protein ComG [Listeria swaminathanii]